MEESLAILSFVTFTDIDNDHLTLQLYLDRDFNIMDLCLNLYPRDHNAHEHLERDPEFWDNAIWLTSELYPALDDFFKTKKTNKIVYELGEEFDDSEIYSIYECFNRCLEYIEAFGLDLNTIDDGPCTCPNCTPEEE